MQVLVVSDGHGGFRYDRSEVGSYLACRIALEQVHQALHRARTGQPGAQAHWQQWLAEELPGRIVERWCQEVLAHAQAHPREDQPASPTFPYGATLGLLVLTPHWWGHSGLGDWDLVRIDAEGHGELLSEESDSAEATFSLCMEGAERYFAARSALVPITADQPPFRLLLSSDGIRKSCANDADFFTLAHYLSDLPASAPPREAGPSDGADGAEPPSELSQALDHISSEGSGDDVSVAIARWGVLAAAESSARGPEPGSIDQPLIVQPQLQIRPAADRLVSPEAWPRGSTQPVRGSRRGREWSRWRSPWRLPLAAAVLLLSLVGAGLGVAALWALGPFAPPTSGTDAFSAEQLAALQSQAQRLCQPEALSGNDTASARPAAAPRTAGRLDAERLQAIRSILNSRRSTFTNLLQGRQSSGLFLAQPAQDPLGALIAWSFLMPGRKPQTPAEPPPSPQAHRFQQLPFGWLQASAPAAPHPALRLCPELRQALAEQWRRLQPEARVPTADNAQGH